MEDILQSTPYYILNDQHVAVEAPNLVEWFLWKSTHDCLVALAEFEWGEVSTIFLGQNMNWNFKQTPILFETMITGVGNLDGTIYRYSTWDEAMSHHNAICQVLIDACYATLTSQELMAKVTLSLPKGTENV